LHEERWWQEKDREYEEDTKEDEHREEEVVAEAVETREGTLHTNSGRRISVDTEVDDNSEVSIEQEEQQEAEQEEEEEAEQKAVEDDEVDLDDEDDLSPLVLAWPVSMSGPARSPLRPTVRWCVPQRPGLEPQEEVAAGQALESNAITSEEVRLLHAREHMARCTLAHTRLMLHAALRRTSATISASLWPRALEVCCAPSTSLFAVTHVVQHNKSLVVFRGSAVALHTRLDERERSTN
jgi:hypothetical protein